MTPAVRAILTGLVDYAGLFPPAGLPMTEAVGNFAAYQRREDAWALGRLVVPVARLGEFETALSGLTEQERLGARWPLSVLLGADWRADLEGVTSFNARYVHAGPVIQACEVRIADVAGIKAFAPLVPEGIEAFVEVPLGAGLDAPMDAIAVAGLRAKARTGGIQAPDIPTADLVLAFLAAAAGRRVAFKATAGLHHPVRGLYPLTYEAGSLCATMFGYLNVVLAATVLWTGGSESDGYRLLTAGTWRSLELGDETVRWMGVTLTADALARTREEFMRSIGSCSFTEPVEELRAP
jgi:hypothetical protein